jgi:hypothetical protein
MSDTITLSLLMRDAYKSEVDRGGADIQALGFLALGIGKNETSGFQAQAYINTETKEIIYAIAGTNGDGDAGADLSFGTNFSFHEQFQQAIEYGKEIKGLTDPDGAYSGYTVSTTGHSLGGGLAQIASYTFGWGGHVSPSM